MSENESSVELHPRLTKGQTAERLGIGLDVSKLSDTRGLFVSCKILFDGNTLLGVDDTGIDVSGSVFYKCTAHASFFDVDSKSLLVNYAKLNDRVYSFKFPIYKLNPSRLEGAECFDLAGANLANSNISKDKITRSDLRNVDFNSTNLSYTDLSHSNLTGSDLTGANLTGAKLTRANLTGATLTDANLTDANLTGANLEASVLRLADLTGENLKGADLTGANLKGANLKGANLTNAKLIGADLYGANFRDAYYTDRTQGLTSAHKSIMAATTDLSGEF